MDKKAQHLFASLVTLGTGVLEALQQLIGLRGMLFLCALTLRAQPVDLFFVPLLVCCAVLLDLSLIHISEPTRPY